MQRRGAAGHAGRVRSVEVAGCGHAPALMDKQQISIISDVLYVTEHCVFERHADGLRLTEMAPGIKVERDIVGDMASRPPINKPMTMHACIRLAKPMQLLAVLFDLEHADRLSYDARRNSRFANSKAWRSALKTSTACGPSSTGCAAASGTGSLSSSTTTALGWASR